MFCTIIDFGTPEFDEALRLRDEVLRKPLKMEFYEEDIAKEYSEFHIGCYDDQSYELLGVLTLKPIDPQTLKMRQVAVKPAVQSHGIGSFLVATSEAFAKQKGYNTIELSARIEAVPFYEKNNYTAQGPIFQEVGIDHLYMQKKIN